MKIKAIAISMIFGYVAIFSGCEKDHVPHPDDCRDTVFVTIELPLTDTSGGAQPSVVVPVDINSNPLGFQFLEKMQGHWQGPNQVMAWEWDWFGYDFRGISPSHLFGIYEGGSIGNLFNSYFVSEFEGTQTIMVRNGGVLNGIYRTSYFVMDSVRSDVNGDYYRFVDAIGGDGVMYKEYRFIADSMYLNVYTSRLGENSMPTRHMTYRAKKENPHLAQNSANSVGFPQNTIAFDFSNGFNSNNLYVIPGQDSAKSATFLAEGATNDVFVLAAQSGDPYTITDYPRLGYLQVDIEQNGQISGDQLFVYISDSPLTDGFGYLDWNAFNSVTLFPDIPAGESSFYFTYLHPGTMYVTVIADHNGDFSPGPGDITHASQQVTVAPEQQQTVSISNINVQN